MKRAILCISILAVILITSVTILSVLKSGNEKIYGYVDNAIRYAENEEPHKAEKELDRLAEYWHRYYVVTSCFIQSSKLEEINFSISKLKPFLQNESEEFYSECMAIRYGLSMLYENELPYFHSII